MFQMLMALYSSMSFEISNFQFFTFIETVSAMVQLQKIYVQSRNRA